MLRILQTVDWLSTYPDSTVNFASFLSGWFLGTPVSELKRENVLQFLAWTMYAKTPESLSKSERKNVFDMVRGVVIQVETNRDTTRPVDEGVCRGWGYQSRYFVQSVFPCPRSNGKYGRLDMCLYTCGTRRHHIPDRGPFFSFHFSACAG